MKTLKFVAVFAICLAMIFSFAGCGENSTERNARNNYMTYDSNSTDTDTNMAGRAGDAVDKAGNAIGDAANGVGNAAEDIIDGAGNAVNDAAHGVGDAVSDAGNAVDDVIGADGK